MKRRNMVRWSNSDRLCVYYNSFLPSFLRQYFHPYSHVLSSHHLSPFHPLSSCQPLFFFHPLPPLSLSQPLPLFHPLFPSPPIFLLFRHRTRRRSFTYPFRCSQIHRVWYRHFSQRSWHGVSLVRFNIRIGNSSVCCSVVDDIGTIEWFCVFSCEARYRRVS